MGIFRGRENFPGGSLMGGNFPRENFSGTHKDYKTLRSVRLFSMCNTLIFLSSWKTNGKIFLFLNVIMRFYTHYRFVKLITQ